MQTNCFYVGITCNYASILLFLIFILYIEQISEVLSGEHFKVVTLVLTLTDVTSSLKIKA